MATRTKLVKKGAWRTLEWFWNASGTAYFLLPEGASIKVRYGVGILGWDSQKQKLDGNNRRKLSIGGSSVAYARMQMKVNKSVEVTYEIHP
ncbi:hypothetical protein JW964_19750 [candidate division KSB1 bacterium]|nr:hypothetical protein [candidate division KSB1 bacterium]